MTTLPRYLIQSIESLLEQQNLKKIKNSAQELSHTYRKERDAIADSLDNEAKILAYLSARMPATYAAIFKVLSELQMLAEDTTTDSYDASITSVLDIGAGPATATCAALELFPNLKSVDLIESNREMIAIGKKLLSAAPLNPVSLTWHQQNYTQNWNLKEDFDLAIFAYTLNEVPEQTQMEVIKKVWSRTRKFLVVIEPGSKKSFEHIHNLRNFCIANHIFLWGPCPHTQECPAQKEGDWCHFSARLPRTSIHRTVKEASKNYEDEKFSYLILSKIPLPQGATYTSRIVRRPVIKPGHMQMKLCTEQGFELRTLSKKDGNTYKQAKKLDWGDTW